MPHDSLIRDRRVTTKKLCDKDFAKLSGKLSGAICLKTLVLLGNGLELFRQVFGAFRVIFGLVRLAPELKSHRKDSTSHHTKHEAKKDELIWNCFGL